MIDSFQTNEKYMLCIPWHVLVFLQLQNKYTWLLYDWYNHQKRLAYSPVAQK